MVEFNYGHFYSNDDLDKMIIKENLTMTDIYGQFNMQNIMNNTEFNLNVKGKNMNIRIFSKDFFFDMEIDKISFGNFF